MRAEQDAQLHALQESAAASLTVSEASGAEGAALRSEIGRLEAALSDAASEHAAAIEASATEGAALRSEIGRLEAVLSEAAAEHASGNAVAVGQEQQQQQLPQAARPSTKVPTWLCVHFVNFPAGTSNALAQPGCFHSYPQ